MAWEQDPKQVTVMVDVDLSGSQGAEACSLRVQRPAVQSVPGARWNSQAGMPCTSQSDLHFDPLADTRSPPGRFMGHQGVILNTVQTHTHSDAVYANAACFKYYQGLPYMVINAFS